MTMTFDYDYDYDDDDDYDYDYGYGAMEFRTLITRIELIYADFYKINPSNQCYLRGFLPLGRLGGVLFHSFFYISDEVVGGAGYE